MKKTLLPVLVLVLAGLAALSVLAQTGTATKNQPKAAAAPTKQLYVCTMCDVTSDKPGKCPKCGMFLEAKPAERTAYACPMHPEVTADKPGKCLKCGMALEKKTEKVTFVYSCPMHTEVVSDKPGTCPKCGMFLEAKPKTAPAPATDTRSGHAH